MTHESRPSRRRGLPTSGPELRAFLHKISRRNREAHFMVGNLNDQGIAGDYTNELLAVLYNVSSPHLDVAGFREAFRTFRTYSKYCRDEFGISDERAINSPELAEQINEVLAAVTAIPAAKGLDEIATRYRAIIESENPFAETAVNEIRELFFKATGLAYGPERETRVRDQYEQRRQSPPPSKD